MNHAALAEALTGRQRWGSYESCPEGGPDACSTCPVQQRRLTRTGGLDWSADEPVLLARSVPRPLTDGLLFADPAYGRSTVELSRWRDGPPVATTGWEDLLTARSIRISWRWPEASGETFWVVRDQAASDAISVDERRGTVMRHELFSGPDGRRLAALTCHGACAHSTRHLELLAADLAALPVSHAEPYKALPLPESLPGVPLLRFAQDKDHTVMHRDPSRDYPASTVRVLWDVPLDNSTAAALVAHAVRLITL
ncbi:hypothetical protein [Streptomyces europaeiscabiei]|uniref:hypothetical protein n=1 Tax=Streptomyces europaeiscabiei TaxID=146819 RepID=UPI0038F6640D